MSLDLILGTLEEASLIQNVAQSQEIEFQFKHELIHATTYSSLLKSDRRSLHLSVGEVLEAAYPDLPGDQAALIARHFDEAGNSERALRYYTIAGDSAARQ